MLKFWPKPKHLGLLSREKIQLITLQSLAKVLGEERAIRSCLPAAFYMLLKKYKYMHEPAKDYFLAILSELNLQSPNGDWSRPAMSQWLRNRYQAPIVSWWLNGEIKTKADWQKMRKSGYFETEAEEKFLREQVLGKSVKELVQAGYPVIVTMMPGFGHPDNKNIHAVVIMRWTDKWVTVADPDDRNGGHRFTPERVETFLSQAGAGSIVLPPTS